MSKLVLFCLVLSFLSCSSNESTETKIASHDDITVNDRLIQNPVDSTKIQPSQSRPPIPSKGSKITYNLFQNDDGTWGYELVADGTPIISQTNIPSLPGISGFKSKSDAEIVASYLSQKMKNGELPAIDSVGLAKLGVLH